MKRRLSPLFAASLLLSLSGCRLGGALSPPSAESLGHDLNRDGAESESSRAIDVSLHFDVGPDELGNVASDDEQLDAPPKRPVKPPKRPDPPHQVEHTTWGELKAGGRH